MKNEEEYYNITVSAIIWNYSVEGAIICIIYIELLCVA
ncbi:hypothetical protein BTJ45_02041 [Bacillus mycoides]|nr:hypothetical protein BTJ45_02041 [Bacillus mycoides]